MIIGIPKEIKTDEYRVSMTPAGVHDLITNGHKVLVEKLAGEGSGILDQDYHDQGAKIVSQKEVFEQAEMIVKVKEPIVVFGREISAHYFIEVRSFNRVEMMDKPIFNSK